MKNTTALVVADLHANLPSMEAVLDDAPAYDLLIVAGDVIGILGWNSEIVDLVRDKADHVVMGNHDCRVREDFAYAPSFPAARAEHEIVTEQLGADQIDWLNGLSDRISTDRFVLAHSQPFYRRVPGYPHHGFAEDDRGLMPGEVTEIGPYLDGRAAFVGHTHEQHAVDVSKFPGQDGLVLNPGSVGSTWYEDACYAVVDLDTHQYELHEVEYDTHLVRERLAELGHPVGSFGTDRMNRLS